MNYGDLLHHFEDDTVVFEKLVRILGVFYYQVTWVEETSVEHVLRNSFPWKSTYEGFYYWNTLADTIDV